MRRLTKEERVWYEALMSGIFVKKKMKVTKPPKDFIGW